MASACLSVQADVEELRVTRSGLTFDGAGALPIAGDTEMTKSFDVDGPLLDVPDNVKPDLHAVNANITLQSGADDLSFLHRLVITVENSANPGVSRTLISYEKAADATVGRSLDLPVLDGTSALSELTSTSTSYALTAGGVLPKQSWTVDVSVTYRGQLSFEP